MSNVGKSNTTATCWTWVSLVLQPILMRFIRNQLFSPNLGANWLCSAKVTGMAEKHRSEVIEWYRAWSHSYKLSFPKWRQLSSAKWDSSIQTKQKISSSLHSGNLILNDHLNTNIQICTVRQTKIKYSSRKNYSIYLQNNYNLHCEGNCPVKEPQQQQRLSYSREEKQFMASTILPHLFSLPQQPSQWQEQLDLLK